MDKSIHYSENICNSLKENNLIDIISEYALGYIMSIIISIFGLGYRVKTVDISRNIGFLLCELRNPGLFSRLKTQTRF